MEGKEEKENLIIDFLILLKKVEFLQIQTKQKRICSNGTARF
jgi:hypothetical protein